MLGDDVGELELVASGLPEAGRRLGREERAVLLVDHAEREEVVRVEVREDSRAQGKGQQRLRGEEEVRRWGGGEGGGRTSVIISTGSVLSTSSLPWPFFCLLCLPLRGVRAFLRGCSSSSPSSPESTSAALPLASERLVEAAGGAIESA